MMRRWCSLLLLAASFWTATAKEERLDGKDTRQICTGMYSKQAWGGPVDPFILVKFTDVGKDVVEDPIVSLVIFEWKDEDYIGVPVSPDSYDKNYVCLPNLVEAGLCNSTNVGEFILAPNATAKSNNIIVTKAMHLKDSKPINYPITKTGYYCVLAFGYNTEEFEALAEFRNAYGELEAAQIPKLPFYGGVTLLYAVVTVFWGFLYFQHRSDILAVQNYITAILVFLVVEMLMTWAFYDYLNRNGSSVGSKVLLGVVAVLNAVRNSFSFFLLLIVCMGYGVVKHTLGRTMIWVRWLAIAHFVFGLVYVVVGLLVPPDSAGPSILLVVLPLAGTLTAFYVWTLNSLNLTLKDLRERKQHVKETMYKKLWWCILGSVVVIFVFFFVNSFSFVSARDPDYVPFHWKSRWFVIDGWLNLVYFADVAFIAYVWRPTANNRRFAMSDEIAQDDDGNFEIANLDIGAPDDSDEDEESRPGAKPANGATAAQTAPPPSYAAAAQSSGVQSRQATQPQSHQPLPRESIDGETIFAVGEDGDKFSDDGSDEESGLVKDGRK